MGYQQSKKADQDNQRVSKFCI